MPTLILVGGPPASGKTTLAHLLGPRVPCPVISRDEIKEGIVHTEGGEKPEWGGPVSRRTIDTFVATIKLLLAADVTVVAEAAFHNGFWEGDLASVLDLADVRVVSCRVDTALARERIVRRANDHAHARASHPDEELLAALDNGEMRPEDFDEIARVFPSMSVDTTDGYEPDIEAIVAFASR